MADKSNADSRYHLTVDTPPHQIPKDTTRSDNPIPLSPQWLLPKPGDNKPGILAGETHFIHHGSQPDGIKASGNSDKFLDTEKRKDVFRPSMHDVETGRRDRWRDEERETNSAVRRDRWREGDKELGDTRRDRWTENSSRHSGEARRAPSERWNDSGNRENNYEQRRESKWNTRWGPDDKESDSWREKWADSGRDGEGSHDKGTPHQTNTGKDTDREGDHYSRPWRPNTSQTRGRGEPSLTPNKQGQMFGYGRGRGESGASVFSAGRGRINSGIVSVNNSVSHSHSLGIIPDKPAAAHGDVSTLRYSRMKLLEIYRMTDVKIYRKQLDGFIEVPSLTQIKPSEPLALSAPTPEESVILKGIDEGEIVSSGMPQVTKDGSVGRNSMDAIPLRQTIRGSREDFSSAVDDYKDESSDNSKGDQFGYLDRSSYEKHMHQYGPNSKVDSDQNIQSHQERNLNVEAVRSEGDEAAIREVSMQERSPSHHTIPWRSQSVGERSHGSSHDWKDFSPEVRSRTSDLGWSHLQKDQEIEQTSDPTVLSSSYKDKLHWQTNEVFHSETNRDVKFMRQSSEVLDRERETSIMLGHEDSFVSRDKASAAKFQPQPSPEDLYLYYKDPQGKIQGPFSGSDLIGWYEAGYFGIDLQVRIADAPSDTPFSSLGDVMPHLRMKARPPPGFGIHKQIEVVDALCKGKLVGPGNVHAGLGELELSKNGQRNRHDSATNAENWFLESLMSGNISNPPVESLSSAEGVRGYSGSSSAGVSTVGEPGNDLNYLLAQRMSLERQRSLPNHLPYRTGKDAASMPSKPDLVPDSPTPHSKLLPPMADTPGQINQVSENVDLLSILQAAADKSPSPAINNGIPTRSNFPDAQSLNNTVHSGMDILQDRIDMLHNQHLAPQAGYGVQQRRLQQQNQPSLSYMIPQPGDHPSGFVPPENLLSSGISQDPHMLSMLQQQYLLSQLQLQSQVPLHTQLSLLDKLILMKQQQKQEQQLLLQQHLLSQVISEHQSHQHFGETAFGHLQAPGSAGNAPSDHLGFRQPHEAFHINPQMPALNLQDNLPNLPMQAPQDVGYTVSSRPSPVHLPRQLFDHSVHSEGWAIPQQIENAPSSKTISTQAEADSSFLSEVVEKSSQEVHVPQSSALDLDSSASRHTQLAMPQTGETVGVIASKEMNSFVHLEEGPKTPEFVSSVSEQVNDMKISSEKIPEQCTIESSVVKDVKIVEGREVKKAPEKKSRKQKNLKTQLTSDLVKGSSKTIPCQQSKPDPKIEGPNTGGIKSEVQTEAEESLVGTSLRIGDAKSGISNVQPLSSQQVHSSSSKSILDNEVETAVSKNELREGEFASLSNMQTAVHRAWKPAPGLKAKSLLEIQQEEQRRAQTETVTSEVITSSAPASSFSSAPWSGVVASSDLKFSRDILQGGVNAQFALESSENTLNSRSRKSQLHDLLAEEVLAKSNEGVVDAPPVTDQISLLSPPAHTHTQTDGATVDDDDFVEAKDTKKSRKKAAKAKGAGVKNPSPVASADYSIPPFPIEKSKSARQTQQEKELLPVLPAGPSLGDFVLWKGDQANSISAPAWSTGDSTRVQKPTSLRDILKEQEKKTPSVQQQIPIPSPAKVQPNQSTRGSGSSRQIFGSSPFKAASPIKNSSLSALPKSKTEDDLFWGPLSQSKPETKQPDFPSLATPSSWGTKGTAPKGVSGAALSRQKPSGGRAAEYSLSSSPASGHSSSKGRRDTMSKHSEAMDFRDWCESELVRLTGTKDTSFLEFCLKQSTPEAEMLLRENLGVLDPKHEFIDKFLNYKELLPSDVIEITFQAHLSRESTRDSTTHQNADTATGDTDADMLTGLDGSAKGGGKKKGKKGKKVSPSVLGFNVVSNRIMMGEIQNVED